MKKLLLTVVLSMFLAVQPAQAASPTFFAVLFGYSMIGLVVAGDTGQLDLTPVECDKELNIFGDNYEYLCD